MSLKVVHVLSMDWGGAAIAALRLHEAMLKQGLNSKVLVKRQSQKHIKHSYQFQQPPETYTFSQKIKNKYKQYKNIIKGKDKPIDYLKNAPEGFHQFTLPLNKYHIESHPLVQEAEIVHLHWVADFINYTSFFKNINKPVVWTMHDMNPFTGGCHYSMDCNKYETLCLNCPQLQGVVNPDYAYEVQKIKKEALESFNGLHVVTPSQWLSDCSKKSVVLNGKKHYVINNGIDPTIFKRRDQNYSRDLLGLPLNKKIILFVAGSLTCKPKGYHLLTDAFEKLAVDKDIVLCAIGENKTGITHQNIIELSPINDERLMSCAYSAADVFVTPSLADNYPNTIVEAQLCGTPVIGFPIGGIKEMIEHGISGLVCPEVKAEKLYDTIIMFLEKESWFDHNLISKKAEIKHKSGLISKKYEELYLSFF